MAPGKKRVSNAAKMSELNLGDLVLAKVKGFPAWPAKISQPEDFKQIPDPKKFFVKFYGTAEIAFVVPADVQAFTTETKNKLSARCKGKTVKYFAQAVQEICEEFEEMQGENISGVTDHNRSHNRESETYPLTPAVDKAMEVEGDDLIKSKEPDCKLENDELAVLGSVSGDRAPTQGDMECKNIKPCSSQEANHSSSPHISSGRRNELSENPVESVSVSSPSNRPHPKEESRDARTEGGYPDVGKNKLTNGNQSKMVRAKKKSEGAKHMNTDSAHSCDHSRDGMKMKNSSRSNMKILSPDNLRSALKDGSEKKEKKLSKDKRALVAADDNPVDMDLNAEEKINFLHRKKMKLQHGFRKQRFQPAEASFPAQISKCADTEEASIARPQMSRKKGSPGISNVDCKTTTGETQRLKPGGKTEDHMVVKVKTNANEFNHCTDEVALPPTKRHCRSLESLSSSSSISENKLGSLLAVKTNPLTPNKPRSPVIQLPTKRRAVLRCDDDEDELQLPKTPVHGGFSSKASAVPRVSSSKKKPVTSGERFFPDKMVSRKPGTIDDVISKQVKSAPMSNRYLLSPPERGIEKRCRESSIMHVSPCPSQLDTEKLPVTDTKPVTSTPKMLDTEKLPVTDTKPVASTPKMLDTEKLPVTDTKAVASTPKMSPPTALTVPPESQNKQSSKALGNAFQNKAPAGGANYAIASVTETSTSSMNQALGVRSKEDASAEKMKSTFKLDSRINLVEGNLNGNIFSPGDRLDIGREDRTSTPMDSKNSDMSMKNLIAAAQLRKKQAHVQNSSRTHIPFLVPDADRHGWSLSPTAPTPATESGCTLLQGLHPTSPSYDILQLTSSNQHENEELVERRVSSGHQATGISLSGGTEGAVARDAFEGMIETLSRTKESIGRATRLAIDCAKYGIANEVVELLIKKLETETSFHRRVDLFFLVDSITQCSHSQKGIAGASYIPIVQAALPRLIGAAAPTGAGAQENRRQCRKVLRLWLERKILPESVLRRFIDDMGANDDTSAAVFQHRRPSRSERAIDDPIREMEGMFVDEYGSNAAFPLPGLLASRIFEEEDEDEDDFPKILGNGVVNGSSSPKHTPTSSIDPEHALTPNDRRHCILEDVDGELEMEDVSEKTAFISGPKSDQNLESSNIHEELLLSPDSPPLPPGSPPRPPPPPSSPPPRPPPESSPPPPPPPPPYTGLPAHVGSSLPIHPPMILPSFTPQQMQHALPPTVNQHVPMVPNTQSSHFEAPRRSDVISGFPPAGFNNMQEKIGFNPPRPIDYKQNEIYMNRQLSFGQRPLQPEHHFSYPNSAQPYQYPPYSSDGSRRNASDEQWRMQANEFNGDGAHAGWMAGARSGPGPSYSHEGYFGPPIERPLVGAVTPIPVHGVQMMPPRPGMSAVSWRPA